MLILKIGKERSLFYYTWKFDIHLLLDLDQVCHPIVPKQPQSMNKQSCALMAG